MSIFKCKQISLDGNKLYQTKVLPVQRRVSTLLRAISYLLLVGKCGRYAGIWRSSGFCETEEREALERKGVSALLASFCSWD